MAFYDDMAAMVHDVLRPDAEGGLGQGTVTLKRVTTTPGANPWDDPTEAVVTYPLAAAVKRLHQRYEGGVLIVETGDMVTFAVPTIPASEDPAIPANTPHPTDLLAIDGNDRAITNLTPLPGAGQAVMWKAWCAA